MRRLLAASALALATWLAAPVARATETCGNGSPDGDLRADEGCYAWVCEQPLDCNLTGTVAPETGGLYYRVAPDLAPVVPYGPSITFQRFYTSLYEQTPAATNYRAPLGYRWQHNWMGWLEKFTAPNPDQVVLHVPRASSVSNRA